MEVKLGGSIVLDDAPANDVVIPTAPHPADVLRPEIIIAVVVEEVPISLLGGHGGNDGFAVGLELNCIGWPAGLCE